MLVTRTSFLISAAAVLFVMATHTGAEARFLCWRGMGSYAKYHKPPLFYKSTPQVRASRAHHANPPNYQPPAKVIQPKTTAKVQVENQTKSISTVSSKPASIVSAKPRPLTDMAESASIARSTDTCVVKEYLDTGVVRFRDVCTKEWAINSIERDDAKTSKIRSACLSKQHNRNGVVIFRDVCTGEWAMNTVKQMALANAQ